MPSPICGYSKGQNRTGVCGRECGGGWRVVWKERRKKKKSITAVMKGNHINSEIFTSGLENAMVQLWQANRRLPPLWPTAPRPSFHQGGSTVDTLNMYNPENVLIFHLAKKGHKNHVTWNCHSSFVHSSSLLMFGFCHEVSLITRYGELQSLISAET